MRMRLLFAAAAAAVMLAGCQTPQQSPYEYRFARTSGEELCLQTEPAGEVGLALQVRTALEQKGFSVRNVTDFGDADCRRCVLFTAHMDDPSSHHIKTATLEYVRGPGERTHSVSTREVDEVHVFGSPADDQRILIWSLVDRLFPDPMPWRDE